MILARCQNTGDLAPKEDSASVYAVETPKKTPMAKLTLWDKNPRTIKDRRFEALCKSLADDPSFMELRPILATKEGRIYAGNMRYRAAQHLGWKEVPAILSDIPEKLANERAIKDNNEFGEWNNDELATLLDEMEKAGTDISLLGLDDSIQKIIDQLNEAEIVEDEAPPVPTEAKTKLGDLYQLGDHRLLCGDATKIDDVERLMDGDKADMVFTDPPYKIETEGGHKSDISKALVKQGESIEFISDFDPKDFLNVLPILFERNKINAYVFCNKELLPDYLVWARDAGYSFNVLVWKKPNAIPIGDSHRPDIEYLLLFRKNAIWNNGLSAIVNYSRLIECPRDKGLHPTMKPVSIIANQVQISSNKGSIVADLFGGSGSTLIACEQLNRKCYMMELDPKYCDVIVQRWETLTGKKATLLANGKV